MGGKTKQSQRTKNNARPSSSGRSAELLSGVAVDSGLLSLTSPRVALFPSLAAPALDPLLTPELQLCLKKLNKKDPITKTKALQELSELVNNSKVDDVVAALPSWTHFYKILTADPDRKVRECTQACHGVMVSVCGRRAAPQLKQLAPAWLQAQYDEHAPACAHAQNSLAKTFPDNKLPEVLSFCKEEITTHLLSILSGNGETPHIKKLDSEEARSAAASRMLSSALHGLQFLVQQLPESQTPWLWNQLQPLLQAPAFWKKATHSEPRIRAAWFGAVGSIIARFKAEFGPPYGTKVLRAAVGPRESTPLVAAALWGCLLLFMHNMPDWHQYLEKKELLSKRILDVLESGGWGDARHLSAVLLPLLANLPEEMLTKEFYVSFFDALFNGLDQKSILNSKSERQSWITSLEECLRFLSTTPHEFVVEVVTGVHRKWVERVLRPAGLPGTHLVKLSAASITKLLKYWLKQAALPAGERYDQLIRNCWQNVGSTLATQVETLSLDHADIQKQIDTHVILLQTLKTSFTQELKKKRSIKFEDTTTEEKQSESTPEVQEIDPSIVERYNHNLEELTQRLCENYFDFASKKEIAQPVLSPLITLLLERDSKAAFLGIARQFSCESVYQLYDNVFRRWLAGDTMRCRAALDIVFMIVKHLTEKEQDALFDSFKQFPPSVVEWCISLSLSHPHVRLAAARRWLRGEVAAGAVGALCRRVLQRDNNQDRSLLLMCLDSDLDGESMVSAHAVQCALQQVSASLRAARAQGPALEARARLAAQLACSHAPHADLISALLTLTATIQRGDPLLSVETWCEACDAWQDGCAALDAGGRERFLLDAVATIHSLLNLSSNLAVKPSSKESEEQSKDPPTSDKPLDKDAVDLPRIEHVTSLWPALARAAGAGARDLTALLFDLREVPPLDVEAYATRHYILTGNLTCPFVDNEVMQAIAGDKLTELERDDLISYMKTVVFRTACLRAALRTRPDEELAAPGDALRTRLDEELAAPGDALRTRPDEELAAPGDALRTRPDEELAAPGDALRKRPDKERDAPGNALRTCPDEELVAPCCDALMQDQYIRHEFLKCVHDYTVLCALHEGYAFWPHYKILEKSKNRLGTLLEDIIKETNEDNRTHIANLLIKLATSEGYFWIYAAKYYTSKVDEINNEKDKKSSPTDADSQKEESSQEMSKHSEAVESGGASDKHVKEESPELSLETAMATYLRDNSSGPAMIYLLNYLQVRPGAPLHAQHQLAAGSLHCAHAHEPAVAATVLRDVAHADPDVFLNAYYEHNHTMLYEIDVSSSAWPLVASNAAISLYLSACVEHGGWAQAAHVWDFTNIALCSLLTSANLSKEHWGCAKVSLLTRSALQLFLRVCPFVRGVRARCEREQPPAHVAELPTEWRDIYAPDLNHNLFQIVLHVLESSKDLKMVNSCHVAVVDALIRSLPHMEWEALPAARREGELAAARLAAASGAALAGLAHPAVKHLAYCLMHQLLKPLVLQDATALAECTAEEGSAAQGTVLALSLRAHQPRIHQLQDVVEALLASYEVCEELCCLEPLSEAHSLTLGYLLLLDVVNTQCSLARGELTHHYMQLYRDGHYTEALLCACLRLLPEDVLRGARARGVPPPACPARVLDFSTGPPVDVYKWSGNSALSRLACRGLWWAARGAGAAAARGWRGVAHHSHAQLLDNIVSRYITPCVVKEEFSVLQRHSGDIEDAEVSINWGAYEVACVLAVDENPVRLVLELSRSHPLVLPKLSAHHAAAGNINWILVYLGYQNGTILNALKMWCSNVNSKMEKAPQCYICYCRLHHRTGRLPNLSCRTCHNKFHNGCLYKWFVSSGKTTCPLCRAAY